MQSLCLHPYEYKKFDALKNIHIECTRQSVSSDVSISLTSKKTSKCPRNLSSWNIANSFKILYFQNEALYRYKNLHIHVEASANSLV